MKNEKISSYSNRKKKTKNIKDNFSSSPDSEDESNTSYLYWGGEYVTSMSGGWKDEFNLGIYFTNLIWFEFFDILKK